MPTKKKKAKVKKKSYKKKVSRRNTKKVSRKKTKKISRKKTKKISKNKKIDKKITPVELIIKSKPEWIKSSLANKAQYQKKIY